MSKSERPPAAQELAAVRLVNECRELGDDATAWHRHLADGLRRLTGGRYGIAGVLPLDPVWAASLVGVEAAGEWPSAGFERQFHVWLRDPAADPHNHFADYRRAAVTTRWRLVLTPHTPPDENHPPDANQPRPSTTCGDFTGPARVTINPLPAA